MTSMSEVRSAPLPETPPVRWTRYLLPLAKAAIFLIALRVISSELRQFHYHAVAAYLDALPWQNLAIAIACTVASYAILASYDVLAIRDAGHPLPLRKTAFGSFVSYAVSNTMSGLVGGSLRYRLYTAWGLTPAAAARVIAFGIVTFWLGFLSMAGVVLTARPVVGALTAIGPLLLIVPAAYVTVVVTRRRQIAIGRWTVAIPSPGIAALQLVLSSADWIFAAGVFHALLPAHSAIAPLTTLAVFLTAQLVGVVSTLPGGVGVFEAAVFALLGAQVPASVLAAALLAYRALYYLAPLAVAGIAVAVQEVARRRQGLTRIGRGVARTLSLFVPPVFSLAVVLAGVVLLASGATPSEAERLGALRGALPLTIVELAHLVGSMAGIGLLLLARGVQRRLDGAWALSSALLVAGIAASLAKGLDYEEAIVLAVILGVLLPCRAYFYRKTALLDEPFSPAWVTAIALAATSTLWLGFFAYRRIAYSHELWWHFSFSGDAPRFLRASIAVAAVALVFSARKLLRPVPRSLPPTSPADVTRAEAIAKSVPSACGFLALLPDKSLLLNAERSAFVMYGVQGRSWVSMGDPAGPPRAARELAWTFFEEADRHNGWPAFYQVRRAYLPLYIELGLRLLKLGEEARVDLTSFALDGGSRKPLRRTLRRLEEEDVAFTMVPPDAVRPLIPELRRVSNDWLAARRTREKSFSLGRFDADYLQRLPLAVVTRGGEIVAFANVWADDLREELTVDLMRHASSAPPGVMDFLFVHLMLHAQSLGYHWFNLGVAPLSGLEARAQGPLWTRLASLGFEHGERYYNFQGLRRYKQKFDPVWEPVFLASAGGMRLPLILADIASLISGSRRGILMK